jgi:Flp pilus assembly protein CpaB
MRRPWRLDGRVLVGLFIAALAVAGSLALWQRVNDARPVVVATRDLPTGATLAAADLAVARVRVDDGMYAAAVPADELGALVGRQLAEPIHPQQMVVRQQVSARPPIGPDQVALTIPVNPASAAGGRVRPGDSVAIILTTNKGKPEAQTTVVLPRVTVYDVGYDQGSAVVSTGADAADRVARGALSSLTLVVKAPTEAVELASARHNGELDVALLPPAP